MGVKNRRLESNHESKVLSDLRQCWPLQNSSIFWLTRAGISVATQFVIWTDVQITNRAIWFCNLWFPKSDLGEFLWYLGGVLVGLWNGRRYGIEFVWALNLQIAEWHWSKTLFLQNFMDFLADFSPWNLFFGLWRMTDHSMRRQSINPLRADLVILTLRFQVARVKESLCDLRLASAASKV